MSGTDGAHPQMLAMKDHDQLSRNSMIRYLDLSCQVKSEQREESKVFR